MSLHAQSLGHHRGASPTTKAATVELLRVLVLAEQPRLLGGLFLDLHDVVEFLGLLHEVGREVESCVIEQVLMVLRSPLD